MAIRRAAMTARRPSAAMALGHSIESRAYLAAVLVGESGARGQRKPATRSGQPEPASRPPRGCETRHSEGEMFPTCSPRPHVAGERVIRISRPRAKFVEGERRDSNPRPPGPQPVGAAWSRAASVLGSAAIGCDQMRPRLSGEPVRASASVTTAGPSERAIAAIAARKCETPRGPESGRRVSNPRPSAWEADALPTELRPP
jgi:hypothetical protein